MRIKPAMMMTRQSAQHGLTLRRHHPAVYLLFFLFCALLWAARRSNDDDAARRDDDDDVRGGNDPRVPSALSHSTSDYLHETLVSSENPTKPKKTMTKSVFATGESCPNWPSRLREAYRAKCKAWTRILSKYMNHPNIDVSEGAAVFECVNEAKCHGLGDRLAGMQGVLSYAINYNRAFRIEWPYFKSLFTSCIMNDGNGNQAHWWAEDFSTSTTQPECVFESKRNDVALNCDYIFEGESKCPNASAHHVFRDVQRSCMPHNLCSNARAEVLATSAALTPIEVVGCSLRMMMEPTPSFLDDFKIPFRLNNEIRHMTLREVEAVMKEYFVIAIHFRLGDRAAHFSRGAKKARAAYPISEYLIPFQCASTLENYLKRREVVADIGTMNLTEIAMGLLGRPSSKLENEEDLIQGRALLSSSSKARTKEDNVAEGGNEETWGDEEDETSTSATTTAAMDSKQLKLLNALIQEMHERGITFPWERKENDERNDDILVGGKKVRWLVTSDSQQIRELVLEAYWNTKIMMVETPPEHIAVAGALPAKSEETRERVLFDTFAEWYLLGLANEVVLNREWDRGLFNGRLSGFSKTARAYNLRPNFYDAGLCRRRQLAFDGSWSQVGEECSRPTTKGERILPQPHLAELVKRDVRFPRGWVQNGYLMRARTVVRSVVRGHGG